MRSGKQKQKQKQGRNERSKEGSKKKNTILGQQRIVGSTEINKPVPVVEVAQQNGDSVEQRGDLCGPLAGDGGRGLEQPDVRMIGEHLVGAEEAREGGGVGGEIETNEVAVAGVVEGQEEARDAGQVAGDHVGEARRGRGGEVGGGARLGGGGGGGEGGEEEREGEEEEEEAAGVEGGGVHGRG